MEREQLIKEIQDLAGRIKSNASDIDTLLTDVTHLYEIAILLKHLPEEKKTNSTLKSDSIPENATQKKKLSEIPDLFTSVGSESTENEPVQKNTPKKTDSSISEKLRSKKINDLKTEIGINEKFQFINELFDGNIKEYNIALDEFNNFSSLNEAMNYLANLKEVYKWASDNPVAKNFENLVRRRFF